MNRLRRLLTIARVVCQHRLDTLLPMTQMPVWLRFLLFLSPARFWAVPEGGRGVQLRRTLESLGPVFIKFGQLLSTRRDLMASDIADELALLQDRVPPFCKDEAAAIIEKALGQPLAELFAEFEAEPLASASVAQVHGARLHSGESVVVKVVRPGIDTVIAQDIALLFWIAGLLQRYWIDGPRLRPLELVADYEKTIFDELDLQREAANTTQLRRNFDASPLLYVPQIYWEYTRHQVMVMERIDGIPVTDLEQLRAQGTNMQMLAERGVEIFFTQVFRDSFFHADMHPGNIFVSREDPANPQYIAIDCAIIGSLSEFDQYYLARNLLAMFHRDYRLVAELHVESGWVPPATAVHEFEAAIRTVCEPIFEKPLGEISFGQLLVYLFRTARRFDMEVQPSLVLLQKTLLNIEGLGRQLYPQLDLWRTALPFLEDWVKERYSPKNMLEHMAFRLPGWLEQLPKVPDMVLANLQGTPVAKQGDNQEVRSLKSQLQQMARAERRHFAVVLAALALFLSPLGVGEQISAVVSVVFAAMAVVLLLRS